MTTMEMLRFGCTFLGYRRLRRSTPTVAGGSGFFFLSAWGLGPGRFPVSFFWSHGQMAGAWLEVDWRDKWAADAGKVLGVLNRIP
jgi:hypothetical protein